MNEKIKVGLRWGLIGGFIVSIIGLIAHLIAFESTLVLSLLTFAVIIAVVIAANYEFRDKINNGWAKFGDLILVSVISAVVFGIIAGLWNVLYMEIVNPDLAAEILEKTRTDMKEKGLEPEEIEQSLAVTKKMLNPFIFFFVSIIQSTILGVIAGLPTGAILKREEPETISLDEIE